MPAPSAPLPAHAETATEQNFIDQLQQNTPGPGTPISGRVLLDGKPMPFFGVTTTDDATFLPGLGTFHRPTAIRSDDGRFTVKPRDNRQRDLVIAGPGFERRVIRAIPPNQSDIGDIEVERGHKIEGTVRDTAGHPVPNATVTFSPSTGAASREHLDDLTDLELGVITVNADDHGHYVIEGAAPDIPSSVPSSKSRYVDTPMQLSARFAHEASVPVVVPDEDAAIDLTVRETGVLELIAPGRAPEEFIVIDVRAAGSSDVSLRFSLYDEHSRMDLELPIGDYDVIVSLHGRGETKEHVSVTSAGSTRVVAE